MSIFMLDCDSVSDVGVSISVLVSKVSEIVNSVDGYDISCEGGFDFSSAKSTIISNLESCSRKFQNTAKLIETVVSSHTSLQANIVSGEVISSNDDTSVHSLVESNNTVATSHDAVESSSQVNFVSSPSESSATSVINNMDVTTSYGGMTSSNLVSDGVSMVNHASFSNKNGREDKSKVVAKIGNVAHITTDTISNNIIKNIRYGRDGYGVFRDRHVISCGSSFGRVGDVILIKKPSGEKLECVIGKVTNDKNTINFYVNESKLDVGVDKKIIDLTKGNIEIINKGQISSSMTSKKKINADNKIEVLGEEVM